MGECWCPISICCPWQFIHVTFHLTSVAVSTAALFTAQNATWLKEKVWGRATGVAQIEKCTSKKLSSSYLHPNRSHTNQPNLHVYDGPWTLSIRGTSTLSSLELYLSTHDFRPFCTRFVTAVIPNKIRGNTGYEYMNQGIEVRPCRALESLNYGLECDLSNYLSSILFWTTGKQKPSRTDGAGIYNVHQCIFNSLQSWDYIIYHIILVCWVLVEPPGQNNESRLSLFRSHPVFDATEKCIFEPPYNSTRVWLMNAIHRCG